jgi:hypothetical protein
MAYNPQRNSSDESTKAVRRLTTKKKLLIGCLVVVFGIVLIGAAIIIILNASGSLEPMSNANTTAPGPTPHRLPEFPWPPKASAYTKVPPQYLLRPLGETRFKDVADKLEFTFRSAGYGQTGYYAVPGGFALVSRLEQFRPDGLPVNDRSRWSEEVEIPDVFSLEYLRALIKGKVGRYRVIVFAVSDDFFSQESGKKVGIEQARTIAIEGADRLPDDVGVLPYTDRHTCTALIYEFEKLHADKPGEFKYNSTLMAEQHLQKILPYLQR